MTEHIDEAKQFFLNTFIGEPAGRLLIDEPMSRHTSLRIGGAADIFVLPTSAAEFIPVMEYCREQGVPLTIIGDGTNVLVPDKGIRGVVLSLAKFDHVEVTDNLVCAFAGAKLAAVANVAAKHGLAGLEFASGIPGTVGGAVYMNAGAYDSNVGEHIERVNWHSPGNNGSYTREQCGFGYRTSVFEACALQDKKNLRLITEATFRLKRGEEADIRAKMADLNARRRASQPLDIPSAGSTFKRPQGHFAGKLIQDAGLQGFSVGGAQVSEKHAGFVVNTGGATAADVLALIRHIQATVQDKFGVMLEPEVRIL